MQQSMRHDHPHALALEAKSARDDLLHAALRSAQANQRAADALREELRLAPYELTQARNSSSNEKGKKDKDKENKKKDEKENKAKKDKKAKAEHQKKGKVKKGAVRKIIKVVNSPL